MNGLGVLGQGWRQRLVADKLDGTYGVKGQRGCCQTSAVRPTVGGPPGPQRHVERHQRPDWKQSTAPVVAAPVSSTLAVPTPAGAGHAPAPGPRPTEHLPSVGGVAHFGGPPIAPFPLSPATARALARGFRPGDLALASATPLEAWCSVDDTAGARPPSGPWQLQQSQPQPQPQHRHGDQLSGWPLRLDTHPAASSCQPGTSLGTRPTDDSKSGSFLDPAARDGSAASHSGDGRPVGAHGEERQLGGQRGLGASGGGGAGSGADAAPDVLLLGPVGRARDLSTVVAAVERLRARPAGRGCVGALLLAPSRERAEALMEAAFALLSAREEAGCSSMHVQAVHGGTRFHHDVSSLRAQAPDLLVATPGRLTQLLTSDQVKLRHLFESLRVLVLDGGEVLGELSFRWQVERLLRLLPNTSLSLPVAADGRRGGRHRTPAPASSAAEREPRAVALVAASVAAAAAAGAGAAGVAIPATAPRVPTAAGAATAAAASVATPAAAPTAAAALPVTALAVTATSLAAAEPELSTDLRALTRAVLRPGYVVARSGPFAAAVAEAAAAALPGMPLGTLSSSSGGAVAVPEDGYAGATGDSHAGSVSMLRPGHVSLAAAVAAVLGGSAGRPSRRESPFSLLSVGERDDDSEVSEPRLPAAVQGRDGCWLAAGTGGRGVAGSGAGAEANAPPPAPTPTAPPPPLVPLHVLAVPYEAHLPYLYVVLRQHVLSQGNHKVVVQFPSASLAALYTALFQALGFPVAEAHCHSGQIGRGAALADFAAAPRGILFTTDLGGSGQPGPGPDGLSLLVWVGLPPSLDVITRQMAAVQQAASAAFQPVAAVALASGGGTNATATPVAQPTAAPPPAEAAARGAAADAPRCLLLLHDLDQPPAAAAAVAPAMAAAGLGRVLPVHPGAWAGPLDAVQHRIGLAVRKVPLEIKQRGLEGLMGRVAVAVAAAARAKAMAAAPSAAQQQRQQQPTAGSSGGGRTSVGAGGTSGRLAEQLGLWARRFAAIMGMPGPLQLSRDVARRLNVLSVPGVNLVGSAPPRPAKPTPPGPKGIRAKASAAAAAAARERLLQRQRLLHGRAAQVTHVPHTRPRPGQPEARPRWAGRPRAGRREQAEQEGGGTAAHLQAPAPAPPSWPAQE